MQNRPAIRLTVFILITLAAAYGACAQSGEPPNSPPVDADLAPYVEVSKGLEAAIYGMEAEYVAAMPPAPAAMPPSTPIQIPTPGGKPVLNPTPNGSGLLPQILQRRVAWAVRDFYAVNLAPLKASYLRVAQYHDPVKRSEWERLQAALRDLTAYESTLSTLLAREAAITQRQEAIMPQFAAVNKEERRLVVAMVLEMGALDGSGNEAARAAIEQRYRRQLDAVEAKLKPLFDEWVKLDQQDEDLAQTYRRKIFTFVIPDLYKGGNKATILVDGDQVYPRIKELIDDTAKSGGAKGYIHVSLWMCDDTTLLDPSTTLTFLQALKSAAETGVEVRVQLWDAWKAQNTDEFGKTYVANAKCAADLNALHAAKIDVSSNSQEGPLLGSMHEKYFIFYNGSEVRAIVGGLNIDKGQYVTPQHAKTNGSWADVHDVAVELSGPAVRDVEEDFSARWFSIGPLSSAAAVSASYRSPPSIRGPTAQFPTAGTEEVDIRVTHPNSGAATVQRTILPELLRQVKAAEQYIYLENYAIFDKDLISAIGRRMDQAHREGKTLPVIILLRFTSQPDSVYDFLHYMTYMHLSFMGCDGFTYTDLQGVARTVDRKTQGRNRWSVEVAGDLYEDTIMHWDNGEVLLRKLSAFDMDTPLYALVYVSPGPPTKRLPVWVHSKVSIFDDRYTGIGSANFNSRSLKTDGEMTAFIRGPTAAKLRETLWDEYWPTPGMTPQAWRAAAEANLVNLATLMPGRTYVVPLKMQAFSPVSFLKIRDAWNFAKKQIHIADNY
jgi:phosphatidylserine/phosphatidylglycerophosphate/cardiolipin synthase-like enzyme